MKKNSIYILSFIVGLLFCVSACKQSDNNSNNKSDKTLNQNTLPDSLMNEWNVAWNKHDSTAIANMFDNNSVLVFSTKENFKGTDIIMKNWVSKNLPVVKNLKTKKVSASATSEMVFFNGTYTLDITKNDSIVGTDSGCYTFIWKLQNNKDWKMELLFFGKP